MGQPAVVMNDPIVGTCSIHQVPNPSSGAPQPAPPMPFNAPVTLGLATTVQIGNKFAVVVGSSGTNTNAPHGGLHASDPYMAPPSQIGRVVSGSATVTFDGKQAAHAGSQVTMCVEPGTLQASAMDVQVG